MRHTVTFKDRTAVLPQGKLAIGVTGDNLVEEIAFRTPAYAGASAFLKIRFGAGLYKEELVWDAVAGMWTIQVTRPLLAMYPRFQAQVQLEAPAAEEDVIVWQSLIFPVYVEETIEADEPIGSMQRPYLQELDLRVEAAAQRAENASRAQPYVGTNGNWYVWNATLAQFVDSGVKATGPQGYFPVKGTDYWTTADRAGIVSELAASNTMLKAGLTLQMIAAKLAMNMVTNGDFSSGLTGWTMLLATGSVTNEIATFTASAVNGNFRQIMATALIAGHKYYVRARIRASSGQVRFLITDNSGNLIDATSYKFHSGSGAYEDLSFTFTSASAVSSWHFKVDDRRTSGWNAIDFKYALALDLTAVFGAGAEPTAAQMDHVLTNWAGTWFDGTVSVAAKANKVSSPTNGNFAGLNVKGDLVDSGKKATDFAGAGHSHAYIPQVSGATNGDFASLNAAGNIVDSGKKAADFVSSNSMRVLNVWADIGIPNKTSVIGTITARFYGNYVDLRISARICSNVADNTFVLFSLKNGWIDVLYLLGLNSISWDPQQAYCHITTPTEIFPANAPNDNFLGYKLFAWADSNGDCLVGRFYTTGGDTGGWNLAHVCFLPGNHLDIEVIGASFT